MSKSLLQRLRELPIARKIVVITMLTSTIALVLAGAAFISYDLITFRQMVARELLSAAKIIGFNSRAAVQFNDPKAAEATLSALDIRDNVVAACIYTPEGKIFATYARRGMSGNFPNAPGVDGAHFSAGALQVFQPIIVEGERIGTIYCRRDMQDMYNRLALYTGIALAVLFLSSLAAFGISAALQRIISRPILELAAVARHVSEKRDYSVRAEKRACDELGVLTDGFNEMLAQIQVRAQALRESQQRLSLLVQNTPLGVVVWSPEQKFTEWNKSAERIFGFSEAEAVGKNIRLIIPENVWPQVDPVVQATLEGRGGERNTNQNCTKDGRIITCNWYNTRLIDESGRVVGAASLVDDITERVHFEDALKASESRKAAVLESALDCIITIDHEGKIVEFNPAAEKTFGYSRAEILGRLMHEVIIPPDLRGRHVAGLKKYLETGLGPILGKRLELPAIRKDGTQFPVELTVSVIPGGKLPLFTGFLRDITERKRAEEDLKRAHDELEQRVEERTRELQEAHAQLLDTAHRAGMAEIATSILHNVGNVLTGVNASASYIGETVRNSRVTMMPKVAEMILNKNGDLEKFLSTDEKGKQLPDYVGMLSTHLQNERTAILKEIESLNKNVEHIRNIVSMQQSYAGVTGMIESIALPELIEDAVRINSAGLGRHGIEIRRQYGDLPRVGIEKHRVLQILVNLLSNAKYALTHSPLDERKIDIRLRRDGENVRIEVADNGIGIAQTDMPRIFRYGFTTRKDGHGFGLHSSAMAAQAMGGSLSAHSDGPGRGAKFTLVLPMQAKVRA